jgi:hypothetical protein
MPVHTLAQIAASYGVQPMELATLVGMYSIDPHAALTEEQTASIIRTADGSDFFGDSKPGRHRFL